MQNHEGLLRVLQHFDGLFSTSANKTGQPTPLSLEQVDSEVLAMADFCVGEPVGAGTVLPSTILDCSGDVIKMVREGAFSRQKLEMLSGFSIE